MIDERDRGVYEEVFDAFSAQHRRTFTEVDARTSAEPWSQELVTARANAGATLALSERECDALLLALRVCHAEFGTEGAWLDFCLCSPGMIDAYGVKPDHLNELAQKLEAVCNKQAPRTP
jgi:hypothetical protein